ncbi:MFS transporter [Tunicatimonas pelagia]|uniref:MFS transporter n=1 Tax=Tunicatimonas pelagia TaxID=931531 RepID=UPI002665652B|nr:MFS transporter [Tunicatimonas pelagia]WKN43418.1 MFS transporter [Tunicatimonas pelagia]
MTVQKARIAVSVLFFVNGAGFASWVPHIPMIRERFELSESELGLTLLIIAIGAIIAMPLAGGIIEKLGSKRVISFASIGFCLLLSVLLLMPDYFSLGALLFLFGMVNGSMDVAMNAHGVLVEQKYQQPIMSSFHGLFSSGGLVGAGLASAFLAMGFTPAQHMLIMLSTLFVLVLIALKFLLPSENRSKNTPNKREPLLAFPSQTLVWYLALLGFFILMVEGAMADWTAIHIMDLPNATASLAAMGFAGFSFTMAIGRLLGDKIVRVVGRSRVLRFGSVIAALGLLLVVLIPEVGGAVIGFGLVGVGLANVVPIIFSSAGYANPDAPGRGIAAVTTMGYFGFLIGPPLIGFIAEGISLNGAWLMLSVFLSVVVIMAPRLIRRLPHRT